MPTFNSPVLPATPYQTLGSPTQPWSLYVGTINSGATSVIGNAKYNVPITSGVAAFDASQSVIQEVRLTANSTSSTFTTNISSTSGQFILFRIIQLGVGGYTFFWPSSFFGATNIDNVSFSMSLGQVLQQMWYYDAQSLAASPMSPPMITP